MFPRIVRVQSLRPCYSPSILGVRVRQRITVLVVMLMVQNHQLCRRETRTVKVMSCVRSIGSWFTHLRGQ